jgi:hypothetical protein
VSFPSSASEATRCSKTSHFEAMNARDRKCDAVEPALLVMPQVLGVFLLVALAAIKADILRFGLSDLE